MEIASCTGNVTRKDGEICLHLHMVVGDVAKGLICAGHLIRAIISLTGEFILRVIDGEVGREYSPGVGVNLFKF